MRVEVLKKDIAMGTPKTACDCPIALALKRTFATDAVEVNCADVRFGNGRNRTVLVLPLEAQEFIERFDDGDLVEPFAFEL